MKRLRQLCCAGLIVLLVASLPPTQADTARVSVFLDGEALTFDAALPYYDTAAGRVYIPVRYLSERLGAQVAYDPDTQSVGISAENLDIRLTLGRQSAVVNGVTVALDTAPFVLDGSTYVPLRFVAENLQLQVEWDSKAAAVRLTRRPALTLGLSEAEFTSLWGEPERRDLSERGYTWLVYPDYQDYLMVGVADEQVAAVYRHGSHWQLPNGLRQGMDSALCARYLEGYVIRDYGTYAVYVGAKDAYTLYFDADGLAYGVLAENALYVDKCRITAAVLDGFSRQFIDLVNVERTRKALTPLVWDDTVAKVAKSHAVDMAGMNTYTHQGSDGSTPYGRMESAGFRDFYQIEIIAQAFPNTLSAFSAHMGNVQYREVLRAEYSAMGAGVSYNPQSDGILYYTQVFYAARN